MTGRTEDYMGEKNVVVPDGVFGAAKCINDLLQEAVSALCNPQSYDDYLRFYEFVEVDGGCLKIEYGPDSKEVRRIYYIFDKESK